MSNVDEELSQRLRKDFNLHENDISVGCSNRFSSSSLFLHKVSQNYIFVFLKNFI